MISWTSCESDLIHFTRSSALYFQASDWLWQVNKAFSLAQKRHTTCWRLNWNFDFLPMFLWTGCCHKSAHNCHLSWTRIQNLHKMTNPSPDPPRYKGGGFLLFSVTLVRNSWDAAQRKCSFLAISCESAYFVSQWKIIKAVNKCFGWIIIINLTISHKIKGCNYQIIINFVASKDESGWEKLDQECEIRNLYWYSGRWAGSLKTEGRWPGATSLWMSHHTEARDTEPRGKEIHLAMRARCGIL